MSDEEVVDQSATPDADDLAIAEEVAALSTDTTATDGKPHSKLVAGVIAREKQIRAQNKRIKELETVAARVTDVDGRLNQAQPIIDAILNNPKLRAEAMRIASGEGTRTSTANTEQPEHDQEATEHAEDYGMYLSDGTTPDTARARRALNRIAGITGRQTDERMRPLAGGFLGEKADQHLREALREVDEDGVPLASEQSIREVWKTLPPHLLANPDVVTIAVNNAIGLDRRNRRTPKAPVEPLYVEGQTTRRTPKSTVSAEDRAWAERNGLKPEDLERAAEKLATGKAITFGR